MTDLRWVFPEEIILTLFMGKSRMMEARETAFARKLRSGIDFLLWVAEEGRLLGNTRVRTRSKLCPNGAG